MKKFIQKAIALLLCYIPVAFVLPVLYDPFNVFHYKNVRDTGSINSNYIKMRYILDNPDKFDAFILGSSKVSALDVARITDLHCYNMTHPWGTPKEYFDNLHVLLENGIIPKTVFLGIDTASGWLDPSISEQQLGTKPYPSGSAPKDLRYAEFLTSYCNPLVYSSLLTTLRHKAKDSEEYRRQFYENGGKARTEKPASYQWDNLALQLQTRFLSRPIENRIDEGLNDIKNIVTLCQQYNVSLIIFTTPLHEAEYRLFVEHGYLDFLCKLADISDYYNFAGINDISINNANFDDVFHHNIETGDLVLDAIVYGRAEPHLIAQGFGVLVTKENVDSVLRTAMDMIDNAPVD
ncbi:MAG: hypothetical protein LBJ41_06830 [Treponema sp.]|jgi:hypothetical protein|nr:hypothetical protein [Treponema sp.]